MRRPIVLVGLFCLLGCESSTDRFEPDGGDSFVVEGLRVRRTVDLAVSFSCLHPGDPCVEAYRNFGRRHQAEAQPVERERLDQRLEDLKSAPQPEDTSAPGLPERVAAALGIEFLLAGLDERDLSIVEYVSEDRGSYQFRALMFEDEHVGRFEVRVLDPGSGIRPAVIGLHGHHESGDAFADRYMGRELAEAGYLVVLPQFRALNCGKEENDIASALLLDGFSLMGLQVYEVLLVEKYMRWLQAQGRVSALRVLSHSGGSSTANLVGWLGKAIRAQATDYLVDYRNRCGPAGVHCETIPALFPLGPAVHGRRPVGNPVGLSYDELGGRAFMVVPYGFAADEHQAAILNFFDTHLR